MGKVYEDLDERLTTFLLRQHMFFVATAPLSGAGLVNLSPKGLDTFRVLGDNRVAYLDLTGSGVETIAHLRENGRITIMFCAFDGAPRIVRLYGCGRVLVPGDAEFEALAGGFPEYPGVRAVIDIAVHRVADSCGFSVPRFDFVDDREKFLEWSEAKGEDGLTEYRRKNNALSLDGLPGIAN